MIATMVCSVVLVTLLGTLAGANAVIAPIVIPLVAAVGITPSALAVIFQGAGQTGLARDTEFGREIRVNAGNVVHGRPPVVACDYHNTSAEKCKFLLHFLKNGVK